MWTISEHSECIMRCTQVTGGGWYRCIIWICFNFCTDNQTQELLESRRSGATVLLIIVSSDKTQLTIFRGKQAYTVYMTIGNIPKEIHWKLLCCAQMLIGYIPITKFRGIPKKATCLHAQPNLFHACIKILLGSLVLYTNVGLPMMSGDGIWHRCHPILANFIGDYPEQTLVLFAFYGECPKCEVPHDQLGDHDEFLPQNYGKVLRTYALADGDVQIFHAACKVNGIKLVFHPFWESMPLANIYMSITPDVLHQLLQGVMKHLIRWLSKSLMFGQQAINTRCHLIPPNHQVVLFPRGITGLSCLTGKDHKNICRLLLGLIVDLRFANGSSPAHILKAVHGLLDFLYLAQLPSQTTDMILCLKQSLAMFHENKEVFLDHGVRDHFNVPKIHSLLHYSSSILLFGTTDNYNTEQTEWLHIDFTKDAYHVTNHKDKYNQMTTWLEQCEKLQWHAMFIDWHQQEHVPTRVLPWGPISGPPQPITCYLKMTQNLTLYSVPFEDIGCEYGATKFQNLLGNFLASLTEPSVSGQALCNHGVNT